MNETDRELYRGICQNASTDTLWDDLRTLYMPTPNRFHPDTEWKIRAIENEITNRINNVKGKPS